MIWRGEFAASSKDNISVWLHVTVSRVNNINNAMRYLYMAEDISLRKEYEAKLVK